MGVPGVPRRSARLLVPVIAGALLAAGPWGSPAGAAPAGDGPAHTAPAAPTTASPALSGGPDDPGGPPVVDGGDLRFPRTARVLRTGSPAEAGLLAGPVSRIGPDVAAGLTPSSGRPLYAGAVVLAARDGVVVEESAVGHALRYADSAPTELPADQQVAMRTDSVFDLASVSKLFTSLVAVRLAQDGRLDLDAPVASRLPAFAAQGKEDVTARQLLTHTSGLPAWLPLWRDWPTPRERVAAVYAVKPVAAPGERYLYSDLNMITLGELAEEVAGKPLDTLVADLVTGPLGMEDTGYNPPAAKLHRTVATEYQSAATTGRGMVRGRVHDENAWSLGGVAGHAGVFSTARDLAVLCQALLNGGEYGGRRILSEDSVRLLFTDFNGAFPADGHGLGFELEQWWYMDAMSSPVTAGHTGYTGTSLVIDPLSRTFAILLTNRVHPSRDWGGINPVRRAVARDLALAVPVRPERGPTSWYSGTGPDRDAVLTLPLDGGDGGTPAGQGSALAFSLWYDTALDRVPDTASVESSADGGRTWSPLPLSLRAGGHRWTDDDGTLSGPGGRRWLDARADLPAGTTHVRWRYATDGLYEGRGVYIDAVRVHGGGLHLDGERPAGAAAFRPDGWAPSTG
ncbi:serine hydrolase [Streptomyces sp. HB2AG]|uniref:serine hydrolase n=1 Tax=Streptomyces sp. HB2AG TaxID=2983400 RepID=UPI0022AB1323|nr:serine hydrolase [Streptomyces sp. HB2AG]MCZ2524807.1 serine hydrolase [Streptomyces sp. HB2AG]